MKTNYEIRYAAHPEDAKGYDTQRIRRDFLMEKVFSDNEVNMVYSMYDRMIVGGARPVGEVLKLEAIDPLKALDYCSEVIPSTTVPHDYIMSSSKEMADDYLALGEKEKGEAILNDLANKSVEYITWYLSLDDQRLQGSYEDCLRYFYILDEINKSLARANAAGGVQGEGEQQKKSDMASHYAKKFEDLYEVFNKRVGGGAGRK